MHAIDDLSDAIDTTRDFLTPIRLGLWLKLAIIVFFVSSFGLGMPTTPGGDFGTLADDPTIEDGTSLEESEEFEELPMDDIILALLVIGGILFALWLCYALIAGVMEFVFIESLRSTEVHMRRYFSANIGNGIRLFLFRFGIMLVAGFLASAPVALVWWQGALGDISAALIGVYAFSMVVMGLLYSIVQRFTSEFVAPIMLLEERGVLSAWSRFWSTFTANWSEYVVYLVLVWILSLAVTIAVAFVMMFGVLALLIPFGIVIFLLFLLGDIGAILAVFVALLALVSILLFVALVWTPITTYFRYYALLLLGDTNDELDLIPDQRAAVRAGSGPPADRDDTLAGDSRDDYESSDRNDGWSADDSDSQDDDSDPWDNSDSSEQDDPDLWDDSTDQDDDRDDDRGW